jgi:hypothetical protein
MTEHFKKLLEKSILSKQSFLDIYKLFPNYKIDQRLTAEECKEVEDKIAEKIHEYEKKIKSKKRICGGTYSGNPELFSEFKGLS